MNLSKDQERVFLKCAEELTELATVLLQEVNKDKCKYNKIIEEKLDVEKQLNKLSQILNTREV